MNERRSVRETAQKRRGYIYKVLRDGVCLKLRLDTESLHYLSHSVRSEVNEYQSVTVCSM